MDSEPIPGEFQQNPENDRTSRCISCERNLLKIQEDYMLEKAVKCFPGIEARETIFEYAICLTCARKAQGRLSEESKKTIHELFSSEEVMNKTAGIAYKAKEEGGSTMDYCLLTGLRREECEEYQIFAYCNGMGLKSLTTPFMLSGQALERIQEMLSDETRDELDRFRDDNFGLPPEWQSKPADFIFL